MQPLVGAIDIKRRGRIGAPKRRGKVFARDSAQQSRRQAQFLVDISRHPDVANTLEGEASAYATLQDLQGEAIPTVHGFYEVWGILRFLALEPVGNAISEDEEIDDALRMRMRAALQRIHNAGFIHGDIARRNFCRKENDDVFLVDLESCRASRNPAELADEMKNCRFYICPTISRKRLTHTFSR